MTEREAMPPGLYARAPRQAPSPPHQARSTVNPMGDTDQACVGRGDSTGCPKGKQAAAGGPRCEDCRHYWELDDLEPGRRARDDDGPTLPLGDPGEAGHDNAA